MAKTYSDLFAEVRQSVKLMSLDELKARLEQRQEKPFTLVDVREKDEFRAGFIPGAVHIPRGHLEMQAEQKLPDKNAEIVVYCRTGNRSTRVVEFLQDSGFEKVWNLTGGIRAWSQEIDPAVGKF